MSHQELTTKAIEANHIEFDRRFFPINQVQSESKLHTQQVNVLWKHIFETQKKLTGVKPW